METGLAVGIELLQIDILVRQPIEPHRAEERLDRFDQEDGLGEAAVVEAAPEMDARLDGDHLEAATSKPSALSGNGSMTCTR